MAKEVPEYDADCHADIEGVFGAQLRNLQGDVGGVDNVLADALHFVAEDEGVAAAGLRSEAVEHDRVDGLLDCDDGIAGGLEGSHGFQRVAGVLPWDAVLGAEGGLVDLGGRANIFFKSFTLLIPWAKNSFACFIPIP